MVWGRAVAGGANTVGPLSSPGWEAIQPSRPSLFRGVAGSRRSMKCWRGWCLDSCEPLEIRRLRVSQAGHGITLMCLVVRYYGRLAVWHERSVGLWASLSPPAESLSVKGGRKAPLPSGEMMGIRYEGPLATMMTGSSELAVLVPQPR